MIRSLITCLPGLALCSGVLAAEVVCSEGGIKVRAPVKEVATHVCATASRALDQITACGLQQTKPIRITLLVHLEAAPPECVGRYLCHSERVELLSPQAMQEAIAPSSPYHHLPPTDVFDSFVTHEMTHALIYQTLDGTAGSVAQNEYIAYAMQFEFLPSDLREKLIAPHRGDGTVALEELNDFRLAFAPTQFAARAWLHFDRPENGCGFVRRILNGTVYLGQSYP